MELGVGICFSQCSIAVKRYHHQGNSHFKKTFNWGLSYSFRDESLSTMMENMVADTGLMLET